MKTKILVALLCLFSVTLSARKKPETFSQLNYGNANSGTKITVQFEKGKEHNHPLFAIWLANDKGQYIQTLYVSKSVGKGIFDKVNLKQGKWEAGEIQRPASLPFWAHQRAVLNDFGTYMPTPRQQVTDAYTGATPIASFILHVKTEEPLKGKYRVYLELNQSWDWNEWWTNDKYPYDPDYKTSSQPAVVYSVEIDTENTRQMYEMKVIGHSHYSGLDGSLNPNLKSLTTALKIANKIAVQIKL